MTNVERGPISYEYIRLSRTSPDKPYGAFECPFFTDSDVQGEATIGPYYLINPVATHGQPGYFRPAIVLRCESRPIDVGIGEPMERTNTASYHGGTLLDEVAALVSLSLGMRVAAGQLSRTFEGGNPFGRPIAYQLEPWPATRTVVHDPRLPWTLEPHLMAPESLILFSRLDELTAQEANALIKAARSYQQAIWVGEWEPERAWLGLVSSVEALVDFGSRRDATDAELLTTYEPSLARLISESGGPDLLNTLAPKLRMLFASTRKFCDFLIANLPDPPSRRPPPGFQIPWSAEVLEPIVRIVYKHRSRALHDGTPFPYPMCMPPTMGAPDWAAPSEMPLGLAARVGQTTWVREDYPLHLHVFEYLVRGAILKWWTSRLPTKSTQA